MGCERNVMQILRRAVQKGTPSSAVHAYVEWQVVATGAVNAPLVDCA
jgi:hypothetical protein